MIHACSPTLAGRPWALLLPPGGHVIFPGGGGGAHHGEAFDLCGFERGGSGFESGPLSGAQDGGGWGQAPGWPG